MILMRLEDDCKIRSFSNGVLRITMFRFIAKKGNSVICRQQFDRTMANLPEFALALEDIPISRYIRPAEGAVILDEGSPVKAVCLRLYCW